MGSHRLPFSPSEEVGTDTREQVRTPRKFKVILLNDDFTPMDFVVHILQKFFQKSPKEAEEIMLKVHHEGRGVAGVFSKEIAEMKAKQVNQYARSFQHPLQTVVEPES